ncbi:MAG: NAD-dependent protein deacetylase [Pseudomonadota bacterium]
MSSIVSPLERFVVEHQPLFVLTGAGCSTGVGIPDYRDQSGGWKRPEPIHLRQFLDNPAAHQRYWARSYIGWPHFESASPGPSHLSLAMLEQAGYVADLITQNVDGLHQLAGHQRVIDLHGRLDRVVCLGCQSPYPRGEVQGWLTAQNPHFDPATISFAPDGDADLGSTPLDHFVVPQCPKCGGQLKPDVVFFGDAVPRARRDAAFAALQGAAGVLVVGSSLMVYSGFRFCRYAHERGLPIAVLNRGRTRADDLLSEKFDADCDATLSNLCKAMTID